MTNSIASPPRSRAAATATATAPAPAPAAARDFYRKSRRPRSTPARYVARPSRQGMGVEEGDVAFLAGDGGGGGRAAKATTTSEGSSPPRASRRLRKRQEAGREEGGAADGRENEGEYAKRRRRTGGDDSSRSSINSADAGGVVGGSAGKSDEGKRPPPPPPPPPMPSSASPKRRKRPVGSGAPRPPRVIVIGAGIAGLACARELSERRHDVLVLEARNRIGGRLRTVDLMLDKEWEDTTERETDLRKVRNWSPVDVGGAFIHGTGVSSSGRPPSSSSRGVVGSHDFGTSGAGGRGGGKQRVRKSERGHGQKRAHKINNAKKATDDVVKGNNVSIRRADDGIGSLNPLYVLARQKLRLPLHSTDGEYTCLVDHDGNLISDDVDREVAEEFNEVLDLATKCCEEGKYEWKERAPAAGGGNHATTAAPAPMEVGNAQERATNLDQTGDGATVTTRPDSTNDGADSISTREMGDASRSPNYVSDDTKDDAASLKNVSAIPTIQNAAAFAGDVTAGAAANGYGAKINPSTDFGEIFEECRRHHNSNSAGRQGSDDAGAAANGAAANSKRKEEVCDNLFRWHVANLEMSSGAPMNELGQRWNDDEPFGYGGDHSYLEGGTRDIVEALAEGFDCRGIGDRSIWNGGIEGSKGLRRSGDFASAFSKHPSGTAAGGHPLTDLSGGVAAANMGSRGVIECGIEVNGVRVVEREEVKHLRKQERRRHAQVVDDSSLRRSSRENRGSKMTSFLDALSSRPRSVAESSSPSVVADEATPPTSSYGNDENTVVQVTTTCGLTLEADAVIVTIPLAILSIPPDSPGHISFRPPLQRAKRNALNRLGVGSYNKCCMSFEKPFWNNLPRHLSGGNWREETTQRFDFIGHASSEHGKDILFFNVRNAPILVAIYGGSDYSKQIEDMHDEAVVLECMKVLKKICSKAIKARDASLRTRRQVDFYVPNWPIDYFVSRWGTDPYSRGAFCYVPAGVNGLEELRAMSAPMYDFRPEQAEESDENLKRPLIMFAGEATTPYHPSTIHGAFETGIREAYRLDIALEPELNGITFDEAYLYQPTFSVRRGPGDANATPREAPKTSGIEHTNDVKKHEGKTKSWWFDHDASILRGVESFGKSAQTMRTIKSKILTPSGNIHSVRDMEDRCMSLMHMLSSTGASRPTNRIDNEWSLPGKRGTWLAADVAPKIEGGVSNTSLGGTQNEEGNINIGNPPPDAAQKKADNRNQPEVLNVERIKVLGNFTAGAGSEVRRTSRKAQKKVDESFTFY